LAACPRPASSVAALAALAALAGCRIHLASAPLAEPGLAAPDVPLDPPLPAAIALRARVFVDDVVDGAASRGQRAVVGSVLGSALRRAGLDPAPDAPPAPRDVVHLRIDVEEDRRGPVGLRVLSTVTFRVIPSVTVERLTLSADLALGDRRLEPFRYTVESREIAHVLLFPAAPFLDPDARRHALRREAIEAMAAHVAAAVGAAREAR